MPSVSRAAISALAATELAVASSFQQPAWKVGQSVKTSSGSVVGHASAWKPDVSEYLGIPFAQPPVGDLRWAAPKRFEGNGTIGAHKFSPSCPAVVASPPTSKMSYESVVVTVGKMWGQAGDTFDEDCLTLNVWSKPQSGEKAKAVMVWIYGGGYTIGNTANPSYNGARLAQDQDVVVVSMNYRLNVFGFPTVPFTPEKNPGLLDQRLAVEWVRDNIAAFGGDPNRIILFGESAGGGSVDMYSFAWTKDPIVKGFIPESGNLGVQRSTMGKKSNADGWFGLSKTLGCGGEEAGDKTLACMRKKSYKEILDGMRKGGDTGSGASGFRPTADGKVVFRDYPQRLAAGNVIKAPMLVGNNDDEAGLTAALAKVPRPKTPAGPKMLKRQAAESNPQQCGAHNTATGRVKLGVPAWRYVFNGVYPNSDIGSKGAYHTAEIAMVFGTTEYLSHKPDTPVEQQMVGTIMKAWSSFAKNPQDGLSKVMGWPIYDPSKPTVVSLGGRNSSEVKFVDRMANDSKC